MFNRLGYFMVTGCLLSLGCGEDPAMMMDPDPAATREARVHDYMETLRASPSGLEAFLRQLPKGGDLHSHTSGAIQTEKLIAWGAEDGACVDPTTFTASNPCAMGAVPLSKTATDPALYAQVLKAWSMEGFSGPLLAAHQHFFDSFGRFGAVQTDARNDDSLADVLASAGRNRQSYVELLQGFGSSGVGPVAQTLFVAGDRWDAPTLLAKRAQLIAHPTFTAALATQRAAIPAMLAGARQLLGCDGAKPDPGCAVEVRFQVAANRTRSREYVFGQWVFGQELAQVVPEVVGVNLVSPEENATSLAAYDDEMFALGVLDDFNDKEPGRKQVHVSLHAGELIPSVLPMTAEGQRHLTFHIRRAVAVAHAERIGHGVDVLGETDGDGAADLLNDMRDAHVMVEICLTSNRALLGSAGMEHPLYKYAEQGVPVALATDDLGILRGDATKEFQVAVTDQKRGYRDLKKLVRASLEHAFIEGASLWAQPDSFTATVAACAKDTLGAAIPSAGCMAYLGQHRRAKLQWQQEIALATFEDGIKP